MVIAYVNMFRSGQKSFQSIEFGACAERTSAFVFGTTKRERRKQKKCRREPKQQVDDEEDVWTLW